MLLGDKIADISLLASLSTVLTTLNLGYNAISDVSPLGQWGGTTALWDIDLHDNKITDLTPLLSVTWSLT